MQITQSSALKWWQPSIAISFIPCERLTSVSSYKLKHNMSPRGGGGGGGREKGNFGGNFGTGVRTSFFETYPNPMLGR